MFIVTTKTVSLADSECHPQDRILISKWFFLLTYCRFSATPSSSASWSATATVDQSPVYNSNYRKYCWKLIYFSPRSLLRSPESKRLHPNWINNMQFNKLQHHPATSNARRLRSGRYYGDRDEDENCNGKSWHDITYFAFQVLRHSVWEMCGAGIPKR